jgi:hypothetical protein
MEKAINQGPMHISGVYCTSPARQHQCDHATVVQPPFPSGLKPGCKGLFRITFKIFHCSARTDRLNDRVLIALTHSLNGTPVALSVS